MCMCVVQNKRDTRRCTHVCVCMCVCMCMCVMQIERDTRRCTHVCVCMCVCVCVCVWCRINATLGDMASSSPRDPVVAVCHEPVLSIYVVFSHACMSVVHVCMYVPLFSINLCHEPIVCIHVIFICVCMSFLYVCLNVNRRCVFACRLHMYVSIHMHVTLRMWVCISV